MPFIQTAIPGLMVFEPAVFEDSRGYFFESYNAKSFAAAGIHHQFVQDNQASSVYGVVRGLHYQLAPHAQTKLVRVLSGRILDVVVDVRKDSPAYGEKFSIALTAENKKQLLVPKGFAHGYAVLSETAEVMYKCDAFYNKEAEGGIVYDDAQLAIDWQIPADKMIVAEKDRLWPEFVQCNNNVGFEG